MSGIAFVTVTDVSTTGGSGIATREIIRAIGSVADEHLYVLCPKPENRIPSRLMEHVEKFEFLPPRSNPGSASWHMKVEASLFRQLWKLHRREALSQIVTRMYPSSVVPVLLSRAFDIRHVALIRGWVNRHDEYGDTKFATVVERLIRLNVRLSDDVFVAFDELRKWVEPYRGDEQSPIEVLPNAVDPDLFVPMTQSAAREKCGLKKDAFIVGFVGSLAERHEISTLLEAVERNDGVHALIVGDGESRSKLEDYVAQLDVGDRVTFTGHVDHAKVSTYISACDVLYGVVSPDKPSNPIKCYEYLACERPVITSYSPEMEFIDEINAGRVLSHVTISEVTSAIRSFREMKRNERIKMGERGRKSVTRYHSWEAVAEMIL